MVSAPADAAVVDGGAGVADHVDVVVEVVAGEIDALEIITT